jgi:hypothetical protein
MATLIPIMAQKTRSSRTAPKKAEPPAGKLTGWNAIAAYLAIPVTTAHRWAKDGMPVHRESRFTVADAQELSAWLGRESHMSAPAHVATSGTDIASALKESIAAAKRERKKG